MFLYLFLVLPTVIYEIFFFIQLASSGIVRNVQSLNTLLDSIDLVPQGGDWVLQSSIETVSNLKRRLVGNELEDFMKSPMPGCAESINEVLVTGLVELCRVKPVGVDAVEWLGNWLINNNPNQPKISEPDDE